MTAIQIKPAPVRRSVHVKASPEHAFEVFTAGFDRWWPRSHSVGDSPLKEARLEPGVGGRWFSILEDGTTAQWGEVLVWEPPTRLILAWRITADWRCDPDFLTEVEICFTPEAGGVRVDLEHRKLEAYGDKAQQVVDAIGSEGGWGGLLKAFATEAEK
jgi:uncharacterized protein YndB with AHSA1/START domain